MSEIEVTWEKIVFNNKPIVNSINLGNGTQFIIVSFFHGSKLFVALERIGSFFFDMKSFQQGNYISEKLNIPIADANIIADWINVQLGRYNRQQGFYLETYIKSSKELYYYSHFPIIQPAIILSDMVINKD